MASPPKEDEGIEDASKIIQGPRCLFYNLFVCTANSSREELPGRVFRMTIWHDFGTNTEDFEGEESLHLSTYKARRLDSAAPYRTRREILLLCICSSRGAVGRCCAVVHWSSWFILKSRGKRKIVRREHAHPRSGSRKQRCGACCSRQYRHAIDMAYPVPSNSFEYMNT